MARKGILRLQLFLIPFLCGTGNGSSEAFSQSIPHKINPSDQAEMVWIPGGQFIMGSNLEELEKIWNKFDWDLAELEFTQTEQPAHLVQVSGFWMYATLVSVDSYRKFAKKNGLKFPNPPNYGWNDSLPMVNITWEEANYFCSCNGGRLPTEAEWEFAARGSKTGLNGTKREVFVWGNEMPTTAVANLAEEDFLDSKYYNHTNFHAFTNVRDGFATASQVKAFPPNSYGLYDMAGNVLEWCSDWYGDFKTDKTLTINPLGPSSGTRKVLKGGAFDTTPTITRISRRLGNFPDIRNEEKGFRCVQK